MKLPEPEGITMSTAEGELPLTSLYSTIASTVLLLASWTLAQLYARKKGPSVWAQSILEAHQFIAATLSLGLGAYIADIGHNFLDARTGYTADPVILGCLYHWLKLYEYLDILLLVLSGDGNVTKHSAFTHLFLPYWSYFRVIARPRNSYDWRFQALADCAARFASRAIPWTVEDVKTEDVLLKFCDEGRWYPDIAISAFWAIFYFQGQRENGQAIQAFGPPYKEEMTARLVSLAIMLYASQARREDETQKQQVGPKSTETRADTAVASESEARPQSTQARRRGQAARRTR